MTLKRTILIACSLAALAAVSASADEREARLRANATVFGPVTLGSAEGLRLCHANTLGDGSIRGAWVVYQVLGDGSVKPAAVQRIGVDAGKGGCMNLAAIKFFDAAPSVAQFDKQSVSLIAILIGLRGPSSPRLAEFDASVQRWSMPDDGSVRFDDLLPAVQRPNLLLPALPAVQ